MFRIASLNLCILLLLSCNRAELKIGDKAPEFEKMEWIQSPPLHLLQLKRKVVLIRWWTDACVFCENTAESLNKWHETYADSGLVIIGIYHPKPDPKACDAEEVREFAREKGFLFPIAIDDKWINLQKFWLHSGPKKFTSVSFLVDASGAIRYIHPGGEYHEQLAEGHENCVRDFHILEQEIQHALREL